MEAMPSSRWDAVIFDYGRVLSLAPSVAELQEFAALVGITEPPFFEIYSATRLDYDAGRADFRQHWQAFADAAGVVLRPAQVERIAGMETLMWLRVIPHDLLAEVRKFSWLSEFQVKIWSCELGILKPDPAIYRACLDALGCRAERTLFFDDRANNVEAARDLGMEAYIFESVGQARAIVRAGMDSRSQ
jgi:putative hydrolase of the HAD superfamily